MEAPRFLSEIFPQDQADLSWVPDGMVVIPWMKLDGNRACLVCCRRLLEYGSTTPNRPITSVSTPSPLTRSRKRMLELEGNIEPVECLALSDYLHIRPVTRKSQRS
ncbi:unnamed protein product [Urochloa humidicola]